MTLEIQIPKQILGTGNGQLAKQVLEEVISNGISEFALCPSTRNAPLVYPLLHCSQVRLFTWPEERSAAFFALGRIKATGKPVAVVTTSGTAVAELLPATMEAYYTSLPLVLITADRPRRFRGKGAPQSAEQVGLFSCYVHELQDLAIGDACQLNHWTRQGPIHLNICFEEPKDEECQPTRLSLCTESMQLAHLPFQPDKRYLAFLAQVRYPLIVLSALPHSQQQSARDFLLHLNAPVYAEASSGLREDPRLDPLRITRIEQVWNTASQNGYPIDGILRIGGVPTARLWRDLEAKANEIAVYSVSENPFSGLSFADVFHTSLLSFFSWAKTLKSFYHYPFHRWKEADARKQVHLLSLFHELPQAEPSLIHFLSQKIPAGAKVYLGNSLPIREWDQAATFQIKDFKIACNRGVNGIDGQFSTFLGFCSHEQENWAFLGDLTVLYDLVAPWISCQLKNIKINLVVVNNSGGKIFDRMFAHPAFQNNHQLKFENFAKFWGWEYEKWHNIPEKVLVTDSPRLIELVPDEQATKLFLEKLKAC